MDKPVLMAASIEFVPMRQRTSYVSARLKTCGPVANAVRAKRAAAMTRGTGAGALETASEAKNALKGSASNEGLLNSEQLSSVFGRCLLF